MPQLFYIQFVRWIRESRLWFSGIHHSVGCWVFLWFRFFFLLSCCLGTFVSSWCDLRGWLARNEPIIYLYIWRAYRASYDFLSEFRLSIHVERISQNERFWFVTSLDLQDKFLEGSGTSNARSVEGWGWRCWHFTLGSLSHSYVDLNRVWTNHWQLEILIVSWSLTSRWHQSVYIS